MSNSLDKTFYRYTANTCQTLSKSQKLGIEPVLLWLEAKHIDSTEPNKKLKMI